MTAEHQPPGLDDAPPVHDGEQLLERWRRTLFPGRFAQPSLWVLWFGPDDRQLPVVMPIERVPATPDADHDRMLRNLVDVVRPVLEAVGGGWVSVALCRPGPALVGDGDRAWLGALHRARRDHGLPLRGPFLAAAGEVRPLVLDDL